MAAFVCRALVALAAFALPAVAAAEPIFVNTIQIAGMATDLSGLSSAGGNNRLGGFASDLAYDPARNIYYGLPDRGPGGGLLSFDTRIQVFTLDVDPGSGAIGNFSLTDTITLKDAAGLPFTGLNPRLLNADSAVLGRSLDPEGMVLGPNGHFYVSDEYGPSVYEFAPDGTLVRSFAPPANLIPRDAGGQTNFVDGRPAIVAGRQDNRGFEGLAITPDGSRLIAVLQDPLVQEGDQNDGRRSGNVRIVVFDTATASSVAQYVYPLESLSSINSRVPGETFAATAQGRNIGVSAIYALSDHEFLVLERDNRGMGIDDPTASATVASKRVYRVDTNGATDVSRVSLAGASALPAGVLPVTKMATPFLDIAAALRAAGLTLPEKIEGLTLGPQLNDGGYLLLIGTDNDFSVTQTGAGVQFDVCFGGGLSGTQVPIGESCPAGSSLLPTFLYAFRTPPGALPNPPPIPEPGTVVLLGTGLAAVLRSRAHRRRLRRPSPDRRAAQQ
jgi:hypothetical protein